MHPSELNISIPLSGVLDATKRDAIMKKFSGPKIAERYLQANSIRATPAMLLQAQRLLQGIGPPRLIQKYINDEFYATVDFEPGVIY